jgi:hypothetical protein
MIQSFQLSGRECADADVQLVCLQSYSPPSFTSGCPQYRIFAGVGTCKIAATYPSEWVIDAGAADAAGE